MEKYKSFKLRPDHFAMATYIWCDFDIVVLSSAHHPLPLRLLSSASHPAHTSPQPAQQAKSLSCTACWCITRLFCVRSECSPSSSRVHLFKCHPSQAGQCSLGHFRQFGSPRHGVLSAATSYTAGATLRSQPVDVSAAHRVCALGPRIRLFGSTWRMVLRCRARCSFHSLMWQPCSYYLQSPCNLLHQYMILYLLFDDSEVAEI